ncbi:hypothetical protein PsYK624_031470 [Phanerochaete sordida]|uniref:Uncharacterized protein n=1 Tax=Phanerochaete sordida TaxID=48140 RepID=A0A9P3G3Q9_9APHY|nr:hypothetical protein PsYK624_031470 [Phanerochaete sordida]
MAGSFGMAEVAPQYSWAVTSAWRSAGYCAGDEREEITGPNEISYREARQSTTADPDVVPSGAATMVQTSKFCPLRFTAIARVDAITLVAHARSGIRKLTSEKPREIITFCVAVVGRTAPLLVIYTTIRCRKCDHS